MVTGPLHDTLPEWDAFAHAVQARRPDAGTWCEAWTTRDVLIHQTGNAEELARVLQAHLTGNPVPTRGFAREDPYRDLPIRNCGQRSSTAASNSSTSPTLPSGTYPQMKGSSGRVAW
jgi:hypothetical protein